jgi:hypothetical protein
MLARLSHQLEVEGSRPTATAGTGREREKIGK